MRKNFNAQKYNARMDKLFKKAMAYKNRDDKIRQLKIDLANAEDTTERQAIRISIFNLQETLI